MNVHFDNLDLEVPESDFRFPATSAITNKHMV